MRFWPKIDKRAHTIELGLLGGILLSLALIASALGVVVTLEEISHEISAHPSLGEIWK